MSGAKTKKKKGPKTHAQATAQVVPVPVELGVIEDGASAQTVNHRLRTDCAARSIDSDNGIAIEMPSLARACVSLFVQRYDGPEYSEKIAFVKFMTNNPCK